jgi:hypothetical protein
LIIIINIILRVDADARRDRRAVDTTDGDEIVARPMVDICLSSSSRRRRRRRRAVVDPSVVDSTGVAH